MLIKVTNFCSMGCNHCMEDSTVAGKHMTFETFKKALDLAENLEELAWAAGAPPLILLSGGECTEHPDIVKFIEEVERRGHLILLITNGTWLAKPELRAEILKPERRIFCQVANDPRFYPSRIPRVDDPRVTHIDALTHFQPLGRAATKHFDNIALTLNIPQRRAPTSFNLRSLTRGSGDIRKAIMVMRLRAATGLSGHCSPSISDNGDFMAGETRNCFKVGTVDSTAEELTKNLINMQCNNCGLAKNLTTQEKRAIGETVLFDAGEG